MRAPERRGPVHVVTVFLVRNKKVLVLRRSDRVGTYRGKWAGVSGYLEPGEKPRQRAFQEVREETGLGPESLSFLQKGPPVPIKGTHFIVHPFLIRLRRGRVRLDWEHTSFCWVAPTDLARLDGVPGLAAVFASVTDTAVGRSGGRQSGRQ